MQEPKRIHRIPRAVIATAAITVGLALGGGAVATVAAADTRNATTLHLRQTKLSESMLQLGQPPSQVGDEFVDHWAVTRDGRDDGTLETVCQVTASMGQSATLQCVATASLHDGELTVQGVGQAANTPTGNDFTFAVTGGTGAYRGVRGEIRIHQVSDTVDEAVVRLSA